LDWCDLSLIDQQQQLQRLQNSQRQQGFDLNQAPLMRFFLIRVAQQRYYFLWNYHHILLDGWSLSNLFQEVVTLYQAYQQGQLPPLPPVRPYRDFIRWLAQQDCAAAIAFWKQQLQGFTTPTPFRVDRRRFQQAEYSTVYAEQKLKLSPDLTQTLQTLARQEKVTLATLVQGAWAILLSRYSGTEDVVFGITVAGRPMNLAGIENMVGLFINTLPLRVSIPATIPLKEWLVYIHQTQGEMQAHAYTPLRDIQRLSEVPAGSPLFESI